MNEMGGWGDARDNVSFVVVGRYDEMTCVFLFSLLSFLMVPNCLLDY
jgi:hypothetical protein